MAKDNTLLWIAGFGVAGYWWYMNYGPGATPATTAVSQNTASAAANNVAAGPGPGLVQTVQPVAALSPVPVPATDQIAPPVAVKPVMVVNPQQAPVLNNNFAQPETPVDDAGSPEQVPGEVVLTKKLMPPPGYNMSQFNATTRPGIMSGLNEPWW